MSDPGGGPAFVTSRRQLSIPIAPEEDELEATGKSITNQSLKDQLKKKQAKLKERNVKTVTVGTGRGE